MFGKIAKALGFGQQTASAKAEGINPASTNAAQPSAYEERLIVELVQSSPYIRPDARTQVIDHLMRRKRLFEEDAFLTLEQKRELGLNTRQKIHSVLPRILSDEGMKCGRPSGVIGDIALAARMNASMHDSIIKMSKPGLVAGVKIVACDCTGETPCAWAQRNRGKVLPATEETEAQRLRECDCSPYCMGYYEAVFPEDLER